MRPHACYNADMKTSQYHFCLIDGTACTERDAVLLDTSPSNIAIIADAADNSPNTSVSYFAGVGTYGNAIRKTFNALFAPVSGDIDSILSDAVSDIQTAHAAGKKIIVGGYSRGAALARRLTCIADTPIEFLFVFDTVASIGIPSSDTTPPASDVEFANATLSPNVKRAYHAVSLDETRSAFSPVLFNDDERVVEEWIPGVHSDIGGGNFDNGLSAGVLEWIHGGLMYVGIELPDITKYANEFKELTQPIKLYSGVQPQRRRLCCKWRNDAPTDEAGVINDITFHRTSSVYYLSRARRVGNDNFGIFRD